MKLLRRREMPDSFPKQTGFGKPVHDTALKYALRLL